MNRLPAFLLCVVPQFLLVAGIAVREELVRAHGQAVLLEVRAIDPMDALAGRFVSVPLAIARLTEPAVRFPDPPPERGDEVFVRIEPNQPFWNAQEVLRERPDDDGVYLGATVETRNWAGAANQLFFRYTVDRYYIPEDAPDPSWTWRQGAARAVLSVRLKVARSGAASIEELYVDGVAYPEWARAHPQDKR